MNRLLVAAVLTITLASLPAIGAENSTTKRASKPAATKSMDPAKGSFHRVHTKKLKLGCDTCHSSEAKDPLFLRGAEVAASGPDPVDRAVCQGCHQAPGKPTWYGAAR